MQGNLSGIAINAVNFQRIFHTAKILSTYYYAVSQYSVKKVFSDQQDMIILLSLLFIGASAADDGTYLYFLFDIAM